MVGGCGKSATILHCLLKCWIKAWNDGDSPGAYFRFESVFAEGDDAIDVEDDAFGRKIRARNVAEYRAQWEEARRGIAGFVFVLTGEPVVDIGDDQADIAFDVTAEGAREDGSPLDPAPRWRARHVWRRHDGEWRIVSERMEQV